MRVPLNDYTMYSGHLLISSTFLFLQFVTTINRNTTCSNALKFSVKSTKGCSILSWHTNVKRVTTYSVHIGVSSSVCSARIQQISFAFFMNQIYLVLSLWIEICLLNQWSHCRNVLNFPYALWRAGCITYVHCCKLMMLLVHAFDEIISSNESFQGVNLFFYWICMGNVILIWNQLFCLEFIEPV